MQALAPLGLLLVTPRRSATFSHSAAALSIASFGERLASREEPWWYESMSTDAIAALQRIWLWRQEKFC